MADNNMKAVQMLMLKEESPNIIFVPTKMMLKLILIIFMFYNIVLVILS